jgi:hypothetical protein
MLLPYRADSIDCHYWVIHYPEDLVWTALDLLFVVAHLKMWFEKQEVMAERKRRTGREAMTRRDGNKEEERNKESKQSFAKRPFSALRCQKQIPGIYIAAD